MNRSLKTAGIVLGVAALLTYPAILLYRRLTQKKDGSAEDHTVKHFAPSYRGNHKPHHRKAHVDGQVQHA